MAEAPSRPRDWGLATRALHIGQGPDPRNGAVVQPIHMATTFAQETPGRDRGYDYSRTNNPTREAFEQCLAGIERATHCIAFSSGLGASATYLLLFEAGDHVVYMEDAYGGTYRLFDKVLRRHHIEFTAVDASDPGAVAAAMTPRTRLVWAETPTNPLLRLVDIRALADVAHAGNARLMVDNTFASPVLQSPLELGADLVLHSTTKYIGGHSDVVGGALVTNDDELAARLRFLQNAVGAVPSPFDCWLLLRGIKTLALRMRQHCSNAAAIARFLDDHRAVGQVHYPGLRSHPQHDLARSQMTDFGGMVSFTVRDEATAVGVLERLRLFAVAESLGAVESLAEHPGIMTHSPIPREIREQVGIAEGLVRLSVGIEDVADLIDDLDQALAGAA